MPGAQRSKSGCSRCRKASRKCDERKPTCSRCERLNFLCEYEKRYIWKKGLSEIHDHVAYGLAENPPKRQKVARNPNGVPKSTPSPGSNQAGHGAAHRHVAETHVELSPDRTTWLDVSLPSPMQASGQSLTSAEEVWSFSPVYTSPDDSLHASEDSGAPAISFPEPPAAWKTRSTDVVKATQFLVNLPYWKTVIDLDGPDFGIFRDFLVAGQRRLHSGSLLDNPIIKDFLPNCSRSATLTRALLSFQTSQFADHDSLAKFQSAVTAYRGQLSDTSNLDASAISAAGLLLCCTSMHLGYSWTTHLSGLLTLAETFELDSSASQEERQSNTIERLAGVDLDVWIIGRQTTPHHIWARKCAGGLGIEPMSGLPRSLLDLIAQASLRRDVSRRLRQWASELDCLSYGRARYHVWQAYCIGTLLQQHIWQVTTLDDASDLLQTLKSHIETFMDAIDDEADLNPRMTLWPLYIAGALAEDMETRSFVTQKLADPLFYRDFKSQNHLGAILTETWERNDRGDKVTPDNVAQERKLELGIW